MASGRGKGWLSSVVESAFVFLAKPVWQSQAKPHRKPRLWMRLLAWIGLAGFLCFDVYNLYSWYAFGTLDVRRFGWVHFDAAPVSFVFAAVMYLVPVVLIVAAGVVWIFGPMWNARVARRTILREYADGGGPKPVIRGIDER